MNATQKQFLPGMLAGVMALVFAIVLTGATGAAWGDNHRQRIVRSPAQIESWPVHGISLSMSAQAAFEHLRANGFTAGSIETYAAWDGDGIEFVRGEYGSPEGYVSLSFIREAGRITQISETFNAPGSPIDAVAEIDALKRFFAVHEEARRCRSTAAHTAYCKVQDSEVDADITHQLTLQILTTMRIVTLSQHD